MDIRIENHGSIVLVRPLTQAAREWVAEHLINEETQTWGGAIVVEPRYLGDIVEGARNDGLEVR